MSGKRVALVAALIACTLWGSEILAQFRLAGMRAAPTMEAPQAPVLWSGAIVISLNGTCGTGFTEVSEADGRTLLGTLAANANAGGTGGSDNITPAGSVAAPAFTGNALAGHAHGAGTYAPSAHAGSAVANHASHTHDYTQVPNHVHPLATGSGATGNFSQVIGTVDTSSGGTGGSPTQTTLGTLSLNPNGGVATGTTAGPSAALTHSVTQPDAHTMSGSSESVSGGTPAGTNSAPAFTGTQFDNRSAFVRVVLCRAS